MTTGISATTGAMNLPANATDHEKLSATAKQFEAIFMRQMLAAARKADFGGGELFGGQALDTFRQMQDDHFADVVADTGTLGFAAQIEAQLARFLPPSPAATPPQGGQ
jgi:flagellar protein FlgJ